MQIIKIIIISALIMIPSIVSAQTPNTEKEPRKQFATLHFGLANTYYKEFQFEKLMSDKKSTISDQKFSRPTKNIGVSVYPFGAGNGTSLMLKGNYESVPDIKFNIDSPSDGRETYELTGGKALDLGIGVIENDRQPGKKFGVNSFFVAGVGQITEHRGKGRRYFVEGGGGFNFGPVGIDIFFRFAQNRLSIPRPHKFYSAPVGIRTTVSF